MALQLKHITKTFGNGDAQTEVLKNINFNVNQGEFIILSGASGSGKSTLLNILGGLLSPSVEMFCIMVSIYCQMK